MDMPAEANGERKVINILFIGESGIGKTTCINSIPHYLGNKNLNQALKKPFEVLIPTHFTYNTKDKNGEWQSNDIKIGDSDNENFAAGESHTLKPQTYSFEYQDEYLIQIIDTPGISDHRGIIQDKENIQAIIDYVSELPHLNLIVFLLEPDNSSISPTFISAFKDFIPHFKDAAENIVFGFTRSSSCGFEVGQTLVPLQILLKEIEDEIGINIRVNDNTSYAFDNVAFRYLCMKKQKTKSTHSKEKVATSFQASRKELIRLIEYALNVTPRDRKNLWSKMLRRPLSSLQIIFRFFRETFNVKRKKEDQNV